MDWSRGSRIGALLGAAALCAVVAIPAASREPRAHGRERLAQYRLPAETIARYAALAAGSVSDDSTRLNSMFADRSPWVGPEHRAGVGRNPYTLVLTVGGVARVTGDVHSQWQAGWEVYESADASREVLMAVSGLARKRAAAGQRLTLTASSPPVSFRGERKVAPMLGLVQSRNLDIDDVRLEVWSGTAPLPWPVEAASLLAPLGVAAAGMWGVWGMANRRRLAARSAPEISPVAKGPGGTVIADDPGAHRRAVEVTDPPPAPTRDHELRVFESLHQVLRVGLAVETVLDAARERKPRKGKKRSADAP
ncbi:MAG: hypothetical protein OEU94_10620 [Aquincola sp.]|nr:hypothetical protein [Aquincola sp.]MDH4288299.1 hypothetical protein [Aquincola sp.]MDH5330975.1 hypothetical protein [Aquincola sp.]